MVEIKSYAGGSLGRRKVDENLFGERILGRTLKEALVMYEANRRAGTAKVKTRGEVKGPNKKLWRQKHTGRARMGTRKSPLWRGGGVVFGPQPRDHSFRMPASARRAALHNAIYGKFRDGEVAVAEGWPQGAPSTKQALEVLVALDMDYSVLVVSEGHDPVLHKSLRNVPGVDVRALADLNAHQVLLRRHVVLTPGALDALEAAARARLAGGGKGEEA